MAISRPHAVAGLASAVSFAIAIGIGCQKSGPAVMHQPAAASRPAEKTAEKHAPAPPAFEHAVDHKYPHGVLVKRYRGTETSVVIPSTIDGKPVVRIESDAFHGNGTLTSVTLPASLLEIGNMTFKNCTSLSHVALPETLQSIGWNAFENCGLESVRIPRNVTHIGDVCFFGCQDLSVIEVDASNPAYASVDGVLYDKETTTLLCCPLAKEGVLRIPATVTTLKEWALAHCKKLTQVFIPAATSTIGANAFTGCSASRETERRSRWVAVVRDARNIFQRHNDGTWEEWSEGGGKDTYSWKEVETTPEYVLLQDASRNMQMRLGERGSDWRLTTEEKWIPFRDGGWEEKPSGGNSEEQPSPTSAEALTPEDTRQCIA